MLSSFAIDFCSSSSCFGRQPCATSTVFGSCFRHCLIFGNRVFRGFAEATSGMSGLRFELEGFGACTSSPGPGMLVFSLWLEGFGLALFREGLGWDVGLESEGLGSDAINFSVGMCSMPRSSAQKRNNSDSALKRS